MATSPALCFVQATRGAWRGAPSHAGVAGVAGDGRRGAVRHQRLPTPPDALKGRAAPDALKGRAGRGDLQGGPRRGACAGAGVGSARQHEIRTFTFSRNYAADLCSGGFMCWFERFQT
eukprot:360369-Prymnesium_polylepis.2